MFLLEINVKTKGGNFSKKFWNLFEKQNKPVCRTPNAK
jgi:hypothetical protein